MQKINGFPENLTLFNYEKVVFIERKNILFKLMKIIFNAMQLRVRLRLRLMLKAHKQLKPGNKVILLISKQK